MMNCQISYDKCDGNTVHMLAQWHFMANLVISKESVHAYAIRFPLIRYRVSFITWGPPDRLVPKIADCQLRLTTRVKEFRHYIHF